MALYLLIELGTTLVLEGWLWHVGWNYDAPSYAVIYCFMRPIELAAAIWLAGAPRMAIPVAFMQFLASFLSLGHSTQNTIIAVSEGCVFQFAAIVALFNGRNKVLAIMWNLLACFDAGYAAGWQLPKWAELNGWWTYAVCSLAFFLIGLDSRRAPALNSPEQ